MACSAVCMHAEEDCLASHTGNKLTTIILSNSIAITHHMYNCSTILPQNVHYGMDIDLKCTMEWSVI